MSIPFLTTIMDSVEGLFPSLHTRQVPFWQFGANVVFRTGSVRKMKGWTPLHTPTILPGYPVRGMGQMREDSGTYHIFWGDHAYLYRWSGSGSTIVAAAFTGNQNETIASPVSQWVFAQWGNWMLATNGVDPVQIFTGPDTFNVFEALTGTTFTKARILAKMGAHILAFNTSNGSATIEWCSEDNINDWTPTAENSAGNLFIRDMESEIIAVAPIGDKLAVYGKSSMHLLSYVKAPFYFGAVKALQDVGAVGVKAVVGVERKNYGLSLKGFFVTDGVQVKYLDDPAISDYFRSRVNWSQISKTCAYHDTVNSQVVWFYPTTGGENTEGVGYDYERNVWTLYNFGRTAVMEQIVYPYPAAGTFDGRIQIHNFGADADTAPLTAYLQSKPFAFETPQRLDSANLIKYVDSIKLLLSELNGTVQVRIGTQMRLDDPIIWTDFQTITTAMAPTFFRRSARYFTFYITSTTLGATWELNGIDVMGRVVGGGL